MDPKMEEMRERLSELGYKHRADPYKPFYKKLLCIVGYHDWVKLYTITGQQMVEDGRACDLCHKHE